MGLVPLPFTCMHLKYAGEGEDDHGNEIPLWAEPVDVECFWWSTMTAEPASAPTGGNLVSVDLTLVVSSDLEVDHRDTFIVDGRNFEVVGLPKDFEHGPFDYQPHRMPIELKWVG